MIYKLQTTADPITFIVASNDQKILYENFFVSPMLKRQHKHQILIQKDFHSAAKAFNVGIDKAINDLLIFAHQDIFFPLSWLMQLQKSLAYLEEKDPNWGILGCFGAMKNGHNVGYVYSSGLKTILGKPFEQPQPIQTLDEIVLIFRKSSGISFDESLPHFHFYGTDICMQAMARGRISYVIPAFCIHNSNPVDRFPKEFYECYKYIRNKWTHNLPIQTTCVRVKRFNSNILIRKIRETISVFLNKTSEMNTRVSDPSLLWRKIKRTL
jgi:hypothetical protein